MPPLSKLLSKFNKEDRLVLDFLMEKIISLNWRGLDIKKLQGHDNIFRLRKGKLRIIFIKKDNTVLVLSIERRNDKTYNF